MRWQYSVWLRFDTWMSSFQDSLGGRIPAWLQVFLP